MKKKRRKRGSVAATLAILAGTALLLYAVVQLWPKAPPGLLPSRAALPGPTSASKPSGERPAASTTGAAQGEEITRDERRALEDILRRQHTPAP